MKEESSEQTTTATKLRYVRTEKHEKIPEAKAEIALPIAKIQALPQGLDFQHREGRAKASVRVEHDTIFFSAHCDSLQRLVERYETLINRQQQEQRQEQEVVKEERKPDRLWWAVLFFFLLVSLTRSRK